MNSERDRIVSAVVGGLIVAVAVGLLLVLLGGCSGDSEESSGPCDRFALAAAPAGTPKPAAPAAPPRARTEDRPKDTAPRATAPSRPRAEDRLQKDRRATPAPTATASKRPAHRHGDGFDLCD